MKQRYYVEKIGGYLNEETLEYDADRWCVLDGDMVIAECYTKINARDIVRMMNFADKIANTVNSWEK